MPSKMGIRYPKDYTEKELEENAETLEKAVTIPVNIEIEAEHRVYDLSEMKEILSKADRIVLLDCGCRTDYGNCNAPRDVCMNIGDAAEEALEMKRLNPRLIRLDEALQTLERSHRAGLVHMAYTMKGDEVPTVICSCCSCCCHTLGGLIRFGIATEVLTSRYVAEDDEPKCIRCGVCVDRCTFNARQLEDGDLLYDESQCFGCGLCVTTCPTETIKLVPRD